MGTQRAGRGAGPLAAPPFGMFDVLGIIGSKQQLDPRLVDGRGVPAESLGKLSPVGELHVAGLPLPVCARVADYVDVPDLEAIEELQDMPVTEKLRTGLEGRDRTGVHGDPRHPGGKAVAIRGCLREHIGKELRGWEAAIIVIVCPVVPRPHDGAHLLQGLGHGFHISLAGRA
uniref:Uncharacterized protein n=1 Tax=Tetraselmis sp. GSL018 TaxID=582737 RepID=A0A061RWI0_9CHLO